MDQKTFRCENAYFLVDNSQYTAYVPLGMIASLHTGDSDEDGYTEVILTTVSGREFVNPGFSTHTEACDFCKEQMQEISRYYMELAEFKCNLNKRPERPDTEEHKDNEGILAIPGRPL